MKKNLPFLGNVDDIEETKDVLMNKVLHDYDFAENPFCIDQVLNMRQLLDSDLFACFAIFSRYHRAICALTNELDCFILDWQLEHNAFKVSASETWDIRSSPQKNDRASARNLSTPTEPVQHCIPSFTKNRKPY